MNYIYIYAIAVLLWVFLPVFLYILSNCRRNHGNDEERASNEDSEKNGTNIDRFEAISCGTIIKTIKKSSRRLSQQHQIPHKDIESSIPEEQSIYNHEKDNSQSVKGKHLSIKHQDSGISIKTCDSGNTFHCHICLDDFVVGDEVRASRNSQCRHLFHNDCIMLWLANQDCCPVCRQDFLSSCIPEMEDERANQS